MMSYLQNIDMKIEKKSIHIFFVCMSFFLVYFTNTMLPLWVAIFLCSVKLHGSLITILVFMGMSPFLLMVDYINFKEYLLMFFCLISFSIYYEGHEKKFLLMYSYFLFYFILLIFIIGDSVVDVKDVLLFNERFYFYFNGDLVNANFIGILTAMAAVGFYINKKYLFLFFSLYLVFLTQSRSSIIFFISFMIFSNHLNLRKILLSCLSIFIVISLLYISPVFERFSSGAGESGEERILRIIAHSHTLSQSFPFGFNYESYLNLSENYGTLDGVLFYLYIRFGVVGVISLILLIIYILNNKKDDFFYYRRSIFVAFLLQGVFESSMYGNYFVWPFLAMCFNSFKNSRCFK